VHGRRNGVHRPQVIIGTPWERGKRVFNLVTKGRSNPLSLQKGRRFQRSPLDVVTDILKVAMDEPLKTHIMYKANLSHKQLVHYLNYLLERGFLAVVTDSVDDRTRFRVTERGIQFLKDYSRLIKLLSP
jgi:predicted transcriptional regulator